ncbi:hypothetical protein JIQ42_03066 [Leishmania sp. Namibia]|uniref:hypothetical protein n=1 Tax=Leishmania sp. Namibia TaxID=2802991 RepID=UPI001B54F0D7|nr:hypothetical protein JIQ42_03066 [Leishmania sp. Namibia]
MLLVQVHASVAYVRLARLQLEDFAGTGHSVIAGLNARHRERPSLTNIHVIHSPASSPVPTATEGASKRPTKRLW